jgi:predicted O-methyltransferase YrrM
MKKYPYALMVNDEKDPVRVSHELYRRSVIDSADYAQENMQNALIFYDESKVKMYTYAIDSINIDGYIAEFGVFSGGSINFIANSLQENTIYGFDSFEGLQEDWSGYEHPKSTFDLNGILPVVLPNVKLIKGYFKNSLPEWIKDHKDPFSLLIIDCDLYSSTNDILNNINLNQLKEGTIILFDEYFGYPNWRNHEFKSWQEFVKKHNIDYEYLAINHLQTLIKIKKIN